MNNFIIIFLSTSILLAFTCCKNGKTGTAVSSASDKTTGWAQRPLKSVEGIYNSLPLLDLPLLTDSRFLQELSSSRPLSSTDLDRLTAKAGTTRRDNDPEMAVRLPEHNGSKFILVGYLGKDAWTMDIYSLSAELQANDHLRIYSLEQLTRASDAIRQTFRIDENYRIEVSKHLDGILIERLTYIPAAGGNFEELRDGKTVTVAYDSYDGVNYIVETFIWDRNQSGGLIRKNQTSQTYTLSNSGSLVKAE